MKRRYQFRKIVRRIIISLIILSLMLGVMVSTAGAVRTFINFGGSNPGGSWFTMAGGMAPLLTKQIKNLNVTPVATGGSADNNRLLRRGELDTCLSHSLTAYDNWNGVGLFKGEGPFKSIRMFCAVYESWHHFVVLDKSSIRTISDLKGKRVAVGPAGSGSAVNSENILRALDLWDKIKVEHLDFDAAGRALTDGHVDALTQSSAPMPNVVTAAATHKLRFIVLNDQEFDTVIAKYPYYKKSIMPAGTYEAWQKDYLCIAFAVYWVAHKELPAKWAYEMLKVAFDPENANYLARVHVQWTTLDPGLEGMKALGIPLHPGAVKFWKEKGLSISTELIPPEM